MQRTPVEMAGDEVTPGYVIREREGKCAAVSRLVPVSRFPRPLVFSAPRPRANPSKDTAARQKKSGATGLCTRAGVRRGPAPDPSGAPSLPPLVSLSFLSLDLSLSFSLVLSLLSLSPFLN